jgi:hypothetical protein
MWHRISVPVALCIVVSVVSSPTAPAEDFFLTIGGGYSPTGNQLSLERNVVFQQNVLAKTRPDNPRHEVYFADGDDKSRDLQCRDPDFDSYCPPARRMMAELLGDAEAMDLFYRNHEIADLTGPAVKPLLKRRMRDLARELQAGDRLMVYVTGHGGSADRAGDDDDYDYEYDERTETWKAKAMDDHSEHVRNEYDTKFYVWDSDSVSASEFATWLDRLPRDVQVILVMVQCHAGGFAHTIFDQADAELGLAPHARCGFFAQLHDRGAAGCTAEANEADYEEYSSYFWGALGGRTRTGETIESADYDGSGQVSFAEAHAYAIIESDTIDVPVRTSDALLRRYSRLSKRSRSSRNFDEGAERRDPFGQFVNAFSGVRQDRDSDGYLEMKGLLAKLADVARPAQRAILEHLPDKLSLGPRPTVEDVKRKLRLVDGRIDAASAKLGAAQRTESRTRERVQEEVREIWPELHADYHPLSLALASERGDEFAEQVEALSAYKSLEKAKERVAETSEERMKLARDEARLQRLLAACEHVVLAANLPRVAPQAIVQRYEELVTMEESTLAASD